MAEIFLANGEHSQTSPYEFELIDGNALTLQSAAKIHGLKGFELLSPGGPSWEGVGLKTFIAKSELYGRFYFKLLETLTADAATDWPILMLRTEQEIQQVIGINWDGAGQPNKWIYYDPGTGSIEDATGFLLNAIHYLEFHFKRGTIGNSTLEWKINGTVLGSYSPAADYNVNNIVFGKWIYMTVGLLAGQKCYFDDLLLDTVGWIGSLPDNPSGGPPNSISKIVMMFREMFNL